MLSIAWAFLLSVTSTFLIHCLFIVHSQGQLPHDLTSFCYPPSHTPLRPCVKMILSAMMTWPWPPAFRPRVLVICSTSPAFVVLMTLSMPRYSLQTTLSQPKAGNGFFYRTSFSPKKFLQQLSSSLAHFLGVANDTILGYLRITGL